MERWTFGVEPLRQVELVAPLLRRVTDLIQSLDAADPAVERLIDDLRAAEASLGTRVDAAPVPRLGEDAGARGRPYVDHSRAIGAFNPCFPEYDLDVDGDRATGTVTFPVAFEGPPGVVHGGVLATFFDCAIQHHNCDAGVAGKTTTLLVEYRRPTPLAVPLRFTIDRDLSNRHISSRAQLLHRDDLLCTATMTAVAGDRNRLPRVPPRRANP
jgi:hypothetical protein